MSNIATGTNYYDVLEVAEDAPPHEVHKAYQRAKATYSSENPALYSMFSPEEARELLRLIEEAYTVLGNPGLRKSYDDARARGDKTPQVSLAQAQSPAPSASQITSDHRQLPDFSAPQMPAQQMAPIQQVSVSPLSDPSFGKSADVGGKQALPPGTGRTSLSTYKIDDAFELELKNAAEFDGSLLQRTRLYKNISIDRLSESTRISRPYLMAVETNDYKSLPAAVFTRGFVVQVARVLGLNDAKVASSYIKMFKAGGGK